MYALLCQLALFSERAVGSGGEDEVVDELDPEE